MCHDRTSFVWHFSSFCESAGLAFSYGVSRASEQVQSSLKSVPAGSSCAECQILRYLGFSSLHLDDAAEVLNDLEAASPVFPA